MFRHLPLVLAAAGTLYAPVSSFGDDILIDDVRVIDVTDSDEADSPSPQIGPAEAHASATAIGLESSDNAFVVTITESGDFQVLAGGWSNANAYDASIWGTATADATATTFANATGVFGHGRLSLVNDGRFIVSANEDDAGNEAESDADTWGYERVDADSEATSASFAIATGVEWTDDGSGVAIENNGEFAVFARSDSEADSPAIAESIFYVDWPWETTKAESVARARAEATAIGVFVHGESGSSQFVNNGDLAVSAYADASSDAWAFATNVNTYPPVPLPAAAYSLSAASAVATATGFVSGNTDSDDLFINGETGTVSVVADALAFSQATISRIGIPRYSPSGIYAYAEAGATAVGIDMGAGDDTVLNFGSIDVYAVAAANTRRYYAFPAPNDELADARAEATAISTGDGDDVIENWGSISATLDIDGNFRLGAAIDAGAGNDLVRLMDGSYLNGYILLGDGDDTLTITGAPIFDFSPLRTNVRAGDGYDTLELSGTGYLPTDTSGFEQVIKNGAGRFVVRSFEPADLIQVNGGQLVHGLDYAFAPTGTFGVLLDPANPGVNFYIDGHATLAGLLSVERARGLFQNGQTFNILTAQSMSGSFDEQLLPEATPFLAFDVLTEEAGISVIATTRSFASAAQNKIELATGEYLDTLVENATGDLWFTLGDFQQQSAEDLAAGYASLSPVFYDGVTRSALRVTDVAGNTSARVMALRRGQLDINETRSSSAWIDVHRSSGSQDSVSSSNWSDGGYPGFNLDLDGFTIGMERRMSDRIVGGFSLSSYDADTSFKRTQDMSFIESRGVGIYGTYLRNRTYIDMSAGVGNIDVRGQRNLQIGDTARQAISDYDGHYRTGRMRFGYQHFAENWYIEPFGDVRYLVVDENAHTEAGAGDVSQRVDARETESVVSRIGLYAVRQTGNWRFMAKSAWLHDFDAGKRHTSTSFAGAPANDLRIEGSSIDRNALDLELGLTYQDTGRMSLSLNLGSELSSSYTHYEVSGQARFAF